MLLRYILGFVASAALGLSASLQQVKDFGANPTKVNMYIYVPDKLATKPAIIQALHGCGGTGQAIFTQSLLSTFADKYGFIIIIGETLQQSRCWDVQNKESLTHGAGGDAAGLISMVKYTIDKYGADPTKVYITGSSSGAMMTNVMAGSYPEIFAAGAPYSGTCFGCFAGAAGATPASPNQTCAQGQIQHTPQEWGNYVRNAYAGYTGARPRMQIFHGLADTLVKPAAAMAALQQWSNVLGVEWTKNDTTTYPGYTQMVYGDGTKLQGFFGAGVGHVAPYTTNSDNLMLKFFGII